MCDRPWQVGQQAWTRFATSGSHVQRVCHGTRRDETRTLARGSLGWRARTRHANAEGALSPVTQPTFGIESRARSVPRGNRALVIDQGWDEGHWSHDPVSDPYADSPDRILSLHSPQGSNGLLRKHPLHSSHRDAPNRNRTRGQTPPFHTERVSVARTRTCFTSGGASFTH